MSTKDRKPTATVELIGKLHIEGNIVPHSFYLRPEFRNESGKLQLLDVVLYADFLYWYRPTYHRDEHTGQVTHITRKFHGDMLQRSYDEIAAMFGITKRQATDSVDRMVDKGILHREFRTVVNGRGIPLANVMFLEPVVAALPILLSRPEPENGYWYWCAEPPKPNVKKDRGEAESGSQTPAQASEEKEGTGGGITKKRDTVSRKNGIPSHEKTGYGIPKKGDTYTETSSKISTESGGVNTSEGNARAEKTQPLTITGQQVAITTTLPAEAQKIQEAETPTPITLEDTTTDVAALQPAPLNEEPLDVDALLPPDGGAADAAWDEADNALFGFDQASEDAQNIKATDTEKIPGGAAARDEIHEHSINAQETQEGPDEEPLWEDDGESTPQANVSQLDAEYGHDPEATRAVLVKALGGNKKLNEFVEETPPGLGRAGRQRCEWFTAISPSRAAELCLQARQAPGSTWTVLLGLLDAELGADVKPAAPKERGGGRQDQARQVSQDDPKLRDGQRCSVAGRLGMVTHVSNGGYEIKFDDGESTYINRTISGQLRSLKASEAPTPEPERQAEAPAFPVGSRWRCKADGTEVVVTEIQVLNRMLSDGKLLPIFILSSKYEAVESD